jgi:uncharacterized circularly permuted ATP-grasp superfamily protein
LSGLAHTSETSGAPAYTPDGGWDEAFAHDGTPRAPYTHLLAWLSGRDLGELRRAVATELDRAQVQFGGGEEATTFPLDPIPRLIPEDEWSLLARGLAQRARALGAFIADAYGDRAIVAAGVIPKRVIESADHFEPWMLGIAGVPAGYVLGVDVVRDEDGVLQVLEDNMRTPSGIGYMSAARAAVDNHVPCDSFASRRDPVAAFDMLGRALRAAAPDGAGDPSAALLSDGPGNSAWWEHTEIASRLGIPIVSPSELFLKRGRLYARLENGASRELQVLYRRTDEDRLRDEHGHATWLAGALLGPCQRGNLSVVNPLGAGLADDKLVHAYVDEMARFYLDEDPLVPSVRTYDLGDPEVLDSTMPRIDELVVKPRSGHGGAGVVVGPHATSEDRRAVAERVAANPSAWIAQETVALSTHPTVLEDALVPRHVDMRPFVIGSGEEAEAVPGVLTRVAFERGALIVNSSQNGGGKDTWIVA